MSAFARQWSLDQTIREGVEYLPTFWSLVGLHQELAQTERKFERTILIERRADAIRRKASPRRIAQLDEQIRRLPRW